MEKSDFWRGKEQSHPGGTALTLWLLEQAKKAKGATWRGKLLDVGCGRGDTVELLRNLGFQADGIDRILPLELKEKGLIEGDFLNCILPEDGYDGVLLECTLCLLDEEEAFHKIARCLKHDGLLLLSDIFQKDTGIPDFGKFGFRLVSARTCEEEWKAYRSYWLWNYGKDGCFDCLQGGRTDVKNMSYYAGVYQAEG